MKREEPITWNNNNFPSMGLKRGVISGLGSGQSPFLWFSRLLPRVKTAYSKIWETDELVVSFDGMSIFRPPDFDANWEINGGNWFHLDQNGINKKGRVCVQGQVNYFDAGDKDGGLVVVPRSHKSFANIFENHPQLAIGKGDFIMLTKGGPNSVWNQELKDLQPIKVCAQAGDLTLWDSRTVHCNAGPQPIGFIPDVKKGETWSLRRIAAYVCMSPRSKVTPEISQARHRAVRLNMTCNHWPTECVLHPLDTKKKDDQKTLIQITPEMKDLI